MTPLQTRRTFANDEGFSTLTGAMVCAVLAFIVVTLVSAAGLRVDAHRAQIAADLAAISGASSIWVGKDACTIAEAFAHRNGAQLLDCRQDDDADVHVTVATRFHQATAKAGPADSLN